MTKLIDLIHDILPAIQKASPVVAGILGGPAGIAAEVLINLLAKFLGAKSGDVKDVAECLKCDPDVEKKLADLEKEHADLLGKLLTFGKEVKNEIPHNIQININLDKK
jgi:hypothetical protein